MRPVISQIYRQAGNCGEKIGSADQMLINVKIVFYHCDLKIVLSNQFLDLR